MATTGMHQGSIAIVGAAETERIKVDLPALGIPSRPTSASTFSSSLSSRISPSSPRVNWRGARLTELLKWILPSPPLPPLARTVCIPSCAKSATTSPVSWSVITVPTGTRSIMSSADLP